MNLLGWYWLINLYRFQVYNSKLSPPKIRSPSITIYLFTFFYLSLPPFPLAIPIILLSVSMRGFLLNPYTFSPSPSTPLPYDTCQPVLCIYESVFILFVCIFFYYNPHISEIIWYLSFSDWLISLSIIPCRSIHTLKKSKISFFFIAE